MHEVHGHPAGEFNGGLISFCRRTNHDDSAHAAIHLLRAVLGLTQAEEYSVQSLLSA